MFRLRPNLFDKSGTQLSLLNKFFKSHNNNQILIPVMLKGGIIKVNGGQSDVINIICCEGSESSNHKPSNPTPNTCQ